MRPGSEFGFSLSLEEEDVYGGHSGSGWFSTGAQKSVVYDIPISEIDDFPNHPFTVKMNEDMDSLIESIRNSGVITPVTLRKKADGRYEMISGHRRKMACECLGLKTIRAEIEEMTDDEAVIRMVDSNLSRTVIAPSEKAKAYRMKADAMKRQGKRTDLTSDQVGPKSGETTAHLIGLEHGDSQSQVKRYIRLNELIPELLEKVDEGDVPLTTGVELSYLPEAAQQSILEHIARENRVPSLAQAAALKELSRLGELSEEVILSTLSDGGKKQGSKGKSISYKTVREYIPDTVPMEQYSEYVCAALRFYREHCENMC